MKAKGDVAGLVKALGYRKDAKVREAAAEALGDLGDARAVEYLRSRCFDDHQAVRVQAVRALGNMHDASAVDPLIDVLSQAVLIDPDPPVAAAAAEALERLVDARAVEPLIQALGYSPGERSPAGDAHRDFVRRTAQALLVQIGTPAVKPLIDALRSGEPWGRFTRSGACIESDEKRAVERAACEALGRIGGVRATKWLVSQLSGGYAEFVVEALVEIGRPAIRPILAAVQAEAPLGHERYAEVLTRLGWEPGDDDAWYWVATGEYGRAVSLGAAAVGPLLSQAAFSFGTAAHEALVALGGSAVEPLTVALPDRHAAEALGEIGDPRAVEPLIAALQEDGDHRAAVVTALGKLGDPRAVEALISQLWTDSAEQRRAAATALLTIGPPAVEPLVTALRGHRTAADALGLRGVGPAVRETGVRTDTLSFVLAELKSASELYTVPEDSRELCADADREFYDQMRQVGYGAGAAANVLDKLGCKPDRGEAGAWYWVVRGEYERAGSLGAVAVEPLLAAWEDLNRTEEVVETWDYREELYREELGISTVTARPRVMEELRREQRAVAEALQMLADQQDLTPAQRKRLEAWDAGHESVKA